MPDSEVVLQMRRQRAALLRQEQEQMTQMARAWVSVERALDAQMVALSSEMHDIAEGGGVVSPELLWQHRRYQLLLNQLNEQLAEYSQYAEGIITDRQRAMLQRGIADSSQLLASQGVTAGFNRLPVEAVENMVGLAGNGSPLRALIAATWPDAADGITQALINGIALGWNPRKVARAMQDGSTRSLDRMMTIARTEQLRAYRESSLQNYRSSGVVRGYQRIAAHDSRVCPACLMLEGTVYPLETTMATHPNCRCGMIPLVIRVSDPSWLKGEAWFVQQLPERQKSILGPGRYDAWQRGIFGLEEVVTVTPNVLWGDTLSTTSLQVLTSY